MSGNLFRMYTFLQVERSSSGRWIFSVWSQLPSSALRGCKANILIKTYDDKIFVAQLDILSFMTQTRKDGFSSGGILILFDEQMKWASRERQQKIFDFCITIITPTDFHKRLNDGTDGYADFMNDLIPNPTANCTMINCNTTAATTDPEVVQAPVSDDDRINMGYNAEEIQDETINSVLEMISSSLDWDFRMENAASRRDVTLDMTVDIRAAPNMPLESPESPDEVIQLEDEEEEE